MKRKGYKRAVYEAKKKFNEKMHDDLEGLLNKLVSW